MRHSASLPAQTLMRSKLGSLQFIRCMCTPQRAPWREAMYGALRYPAWRGAADVHRREHVEGKSLTTIEAAVGAGTITAYLDMQIRSVISTVRDCVSPGSAQVCQHDFHLYSHVT
ncbi:hypothetical protein J6590_007988 [Homalodisca vitripennis]|nr:hypothetical protein J6590_007988 [Homalodisca vitripennis]